MPAEKAPVVFTHVQKLKQLEEQIALENHHESALPSQRYRISRTFPVKLNPIVPQDASVLLESSSAVEQFPPGFLELNAPQQRAPALGNPLFGYSVHPMPPKVLAETEYARMDSKAATRLKELSRMLEAERQMRREAEAKLALASPRKS